MKIINVLEKVLVIVGILLYSDAVAPLLNKGVSFFSPIEKLLYYLTPLLTAGFLIIYWRKVPGIVRWDKCLWILLGITVMSVLWSVSPPTTFRATLHLIRVVLLGTFMAIRYSLKEQVRLLAWTFGIAAALSLLFGLLIPQYGIMGQGLEFDVENRLHAGAWRGVFTHKNPLGRYMGLGSLVFLLWSDSGRLATLLRYCGLAACVLLIILSTSKSSLLIFFIIALLLPCFRALRWNYSAVIPLTVISILAAGSVLLLFLDNIEVFLGAIGRDLTLTGRTTLWQEVWISISERLWLGYGLGAFWQGLDGESAIIWHSMKWEVPHAHNGSLDLMIDIGLIGFVALLVSYISNMIYALRLIRLDSTMESLYPILFLLFTFLANLTESSFYEQGFMVLLYVSVSLSLRKVYQRTASQSNSLTTIDSTHEIVCS